MLDKGMSFLQIRDLGVSFPGKKGFFWGSAAEPIRAVEGVNLTVEKGEVLGLVGESGCGKSTLSRAIMQLQPVTSGNIVLEGDDLTALSPSAVRRRRLDFQMIFQDPYASLNPRYTVFATLSEALRRRSHVSGGALRDAIAQLMARVGLDPAYMHKYPHEFSGGQRQRVAIARALAPQPKLIIADEPVSALDVSIQSQILNLLNDLIHDLGLTMIFISHDLSVVRYIADNIAVMSKGHLVEYGSAEDVFMRPQHDYTRRLLAAIPSLG